MKTNGTLDRGTSDKAVLRLAGAQGIVYVVTGLWPLASMRTFEAITGPKVDRWLVKTTGLLIAAIGGTLVISARKGRIPPEVALLGGGVAAALGSSALYYALRGRISRVYLLDATMELGLAAAWIGLGSRDERLRAEISEAQTSGAW